MSPPTGSSGTGSDALVCAGTNSGTLTHGLIDSHAYSVFGVLEADLETGRPRLIKLRNPWGEREWTGAWSKVWLRRERRDTQVLNTGPGEFYMRLEEFKRNFGLLTICHILGPTWREKQQRCEISPHCTRVEITLELEDRAETMIAFSQIGRRQLRDEMGTDDTLLEIRLDVYSALQDNDVSTVNSGGCQD